ncbi:MAG: CDP-alcohol phosphatidyltransferase family protein, partial [Candidatus Staskawiczbacteria bacterium]|nr:CDP-alcohol phosphatidyltransferase family protein [Candidatus Staskawiczbacteria bacterium]
MDRINSSKSWFVRNLANIITSLGFVLCFVLLWAVVAHREQIGAILMLSGVILFTDFLDGKIARHFKTASRFGAAADRLRDKLFQLTMYTFFLLDQQVYHTVKAAVCILMVMEIILLVLWFFGIRRKLDI